VAAQKPAARYRQQDHQRQLEGGTGKTPGLARISDQALIAPLLSIESYPALARAMGSPTLFDP